MSTTYKNFLHEHNETFVKPFLGYIPNPLRPPISDEEFARIKNGVRSLLAFAKNDPILFPGRDVWPFYLLAKKSSHPSLIYDPSVSRATAYNWARRNATSLHPKTITFDTGFAGSILDTINNRRYDSLDKGTYNDCKLRGILFSSERSYPQTFPQYRGARELILKVEEFPQYYESGELGEYEEIFGLLSQRKIVQKFSDRATFERAAAYTQWFWKANVPKFIEKAKPKRGVPKSYKIEKVTQTFALSAWEATPSEVTTTTSNNTVEFYSPSDIFTTKSTLFIAS